MVEYFGSRLLVWMDYSDPAAIWSDVARTTPIAQGAQIASVQNKGTLAFFNQQSVVGSRPIWTPDGASAHDGLDDGYQSSSTLNLSAYSQLTVAAAFTKDTDAAIGMLMELGANAGAGAGTFAVRAPHGTAVAALGVLLFGTAATSAGITNNVFAAPMPPKTFMCKFDLTQTTKETAQVLFINGAQITQTSGTQANPAGTVFGTATFNTGRRNNSTQPYAGKLYQQVIIAGGLTPAETSFLHRFLARKSGV